VALQDRAGGYQLGDVLHRAEQLQRAPRRVAADARLVAHPDLPAVAVQQTVLALERTAVAAALRQRSQHAPAIFGVQAFGPQRRPRHEFLRRIAGQPQDLRADEGGGADLVERRRVDGDGQVFQQVAVAHFDELRCTVRAERFHVGSKRGGPPEAGGFSAGFRDLAPGRGKVVQAAH